MSLSLPSHSSITPLSLPFTPFNPFKLLNLLTLFNPILNGNQNQNEDENQNKNHLNKSTFKPLKRINIKHINKTTYQRIKISTKQLY